MSGILSNIKGTSQSSFKISKGGPTIRQGLGDPSIGPEPGSDGDLYIRRNSRQDLYQRIDGIWMQVNSMQTVYERSVVPNITLDHTKGGMTIKDAINPVIGDLFSVSNNTGSDIYFKVDSTGIETTGNIIAKGDDVIGLMRRMDYFMMG